jgi:hypothetical protein
MAYSKWQIAEGNRTRLVFFAIGYLPFAICSGPKKQLTAIERCDKSMFAAKRSGETNA